MILGRCARISISHISRTSFAHSRHGSRNLALNCHNRSVVITKGRTSVGIRRIKRMFGSHAIYGIACSKSLLLRQPYATEWDPGFRVASSVIFGIVIICLPDTNLLFHNIDYRKDPALSRDPSITLPRGGTVEVIYKRIVITPNRSSQHKNHQIFAEPKSYLFFNVFCIPQHSTFLFLFYDLQIY